MLIEYRLTRKMC